MVPARLGASAAVTPIVAISSSWPSINFHCSELLHMQAGTYAFTAGVAKEPVVPARLDASAAVTLAVAISSGWPLFDPIAQCFRTCRLGRMPSQQAWQKSQWCLHGWAHRLQSRSQSPLEQCCVRCCA